MILMCIAKHSIPCSTETLFQEFEATLLFRVAQAQLVQHEACFRLQELANLHSTNNTQSFIDDEMI
jgi:hypothetical protein